MRRQCAFVLLLATVTAGCFRGEDTVREKDLLAGRRLYLSYGCAACHGMEGHGDGPAARSLTAAPRDFRRAESFRRGRSVEAIAETVASGLPDSDGMPASPFIPRQERRLLAEYIRSLAPERPAGDGDQKE